MAKLEDSPGTSVPHESGPERDLVGVHHVPSSVRTAPETNVQLQDGFTQKKGTGPRKASKEYGGPKLHSAHQSGGGAAPSMDSYTKNPTRPNPNQTNDGEY